MLQILVGSSWGLGIGLLEQSGDLSLVVPWFDVSRLFRVVVRLPFHPTPPILTKTNPPKPSGSCDKRVDVTQQRNGK